MPTQDSPIMRMTASEISAAVCSGEFSATQVAQAALDSVSKHDEKINAYLQVTEDLALERAAALDSRRAAGEQLPPLAGVPLAVKDNMNLLGTRTTCGSRMLEGYTSVYTATCVQNMLDAGCLPIGKANMDEFAFGSSTETSYFGPSRNPFDTQRVPGGSSGGSAAAVAAGMATVALGSDTGGSIRQPGAFCGLVAMKPTYGVVSRFGVVAFASSLDQVGPLTHTVQDAALVMDSLASHDPKDSTSQVPQTSFTSQLQGGVDGVRVGVVRSMIEAEGIQPEVRSAVLQAATELERQGAILVDVELPHAEDAMAAYYVIGPAEAFSNLSRFDSVRYGHRTQGIQTLDEQMALSRAEGFGPEVIRRIMLGSYLLSSGPYDEYYLPAQKVRTLITDDYTQAFSQVDTILMPTTPRTAFRFGEITDPTEMYLSDMFTVSINIAGNCGISIPVGLGEDSGLPVGVQLVGRQFGDAELLRYAAALESAYARVTPAPLFSPTKSEGGAL